MSIRVFLLVAVWVGVLGGAAPTRAQSVDFLDALPNCNFTDAAPGGDMVIGAVVYNYRTGGGCTENLDEAFPVASVPKLIVAATMFDWILENEAITFDTELTFSERYWMGGRGDCLDGATLNQRVTLGELGDVMISCSDNAATWMLMDAMGWDRVNEYATSLGIEGVGEIIPYAEVDRQKLIFLDPAWEHVPVAAASRYYRAEMVTGLEPYFDELPAYDRDDEIRANALYFENTTFNTLTPRAAAAFINKLAQDAPRDDNAGQVARWVFNTMLLTDRQFTAQAFPGTVTVGAKNGWDTGLRAEVNVMFDRLPDEERDPSSFAIIFARQTDFDSPGLQPPSPSANGTINQFLLSLSPVINNILYPGYIPLEVAASRQVSTIIVNPRIVLDACWNPYANAGYQFDMRGQLESCWANQRESQVAPGDDLGVGLVLWRLGEEDTRLTFVFTSPDDVKRSYQTQRFFQQTAAIYYWHPVGPTEIGTWTVEVFLNRVPVLRREVEIASLF